MTKRLFGDLRVQFGLALLWILGAWPFGGAAAAGMALGVAGTGASVVGTGLITRLLGRTMAESDAETDEEKAKQSRWGGAAVVVFFLLKLPIFVACALAAQGLGGPGLAAFGAGVVLVYFQLVAWAQCQH